MTKYNSIHGSLSLLNADLLDVGLLGEIVEMCGGNSDKFVLKIEESAPWEEGKSLAYGAIVSSFMYPNH
jgi:hypothetical protein